MGQSETERHMQTLDDKELQCIVALNRGGYTDEAIRLAHDELRRRSCRVLSGQEYLDEYPGERITESGFCAACVEHTSDETAGTVQLRHIIPFLVAFGTWLSGGLMDSCPACRSVVQSKWLWIVVPVRRLGRYRVIWPEGRGGTDLVDGSFLSRRLRE